MRGLKCFGLFKKVVKRGDSSVLGYSKGCKERGFKCFGLFKRL
jgi:hypothetical protein